jgi:amidase
MNQTLSRRSLLSAAAVTSVAACASTPAPSPASGPSDVMGELDGVGIAALIRSRDITAREAVEAAIARAERMEPRVNAIATACFERALETAGTPQTGPFAGVPTLVKDLTALAGVKLMIGCRAYAENVAQDTAPYVRAMLAAGLTPIGKSTTPEFGLTATTEPLLTGTTRNPWNVDHSSGGSSGGAAAAVACGIVPVAHASDGGGSIRIPASCCGLVGLKPSRGRTAAGINREIPIDLSVHGVVSRSVRDTAAWFAATEATGAGAPLTPIGLVTGPSQRRLRIGLGITDASGNQPTPEVAAAITAIAAQCEALGHRVTELSPMLDGEAFKNAFILYWASGAAQSIGQIQAQRPGVPLDTLVEPLTQQLAALWQRQPAGTLARIVATMRAAESSYAAAFSTIDVMLTPVVTRPAPRIGELAPTLPFEQGFAEVTERYVTYTPIENVTGAPAISLPLAMSSDGLPIGAHFTAGLGNERTLLELAYELELAMPWSARKPPLWIS